MEKQSNILLKFAGILLIIGGTVNIILDIISLIGLGVLALVSSNEANMGFLVLANIFFLMGAIVSLIAGIKGVKNAGRPEKAKTCITFGILTAVFTVLGSIITIIAGESFNFIGFLLGLLLPAIYLVGAFQNKNLIGTVRKETLAQ